MKNKKRLIDLDKLISYFEEQYNIAMDDPDHVSGYVMAALRTCIQYFKTIPTVEADEVVHGEWISWEEADNFIPSPDRHECSVCHDAAQVLVNGLELLSPYCPNCGAKMDGGN